MSELLYFWDMHDISVYENMGCIGRLLHFYSSTFHALASARWVETQINNKTCHVFSSLFRRQFFTSEFTGVNDCKWPMTVILCVITKCNFHIKFENVEDQCCGVKALAAVSWNSTVGHSRGYFDNLAILYILHA